jgi:2-polyprenyl-3-methyl-5-hydroxy-6-metoxy-1,4-benzoquinol methylase
MNYLSNLIPLVLLKSLRKKEVNYLKKIFMRFKGLPDINELWGLMNETWIELGCDSSKIDDRTNKFYKHPIWLLNGLFSEKDFISVEFRKTFTKYIKKQKPKRIADFGGGYGALANFIAKALPSSEIEIIDPHPNPAVVYYRKSKNFRFVKKFTGKYNMIIATDVFEHLIDPISSLQICDKYLSIDGQFLIANCFEPVIFCHLPQHFHFRNSWDYIMKAMGYKIKTRVAYGTVYTKHIVANEDAVRRISSCSKIIYNFVNSIPLYKGRNILCKLFNSICYLFIK